MTGEGPAFVDTNIFVYAFERSDSPRKQVARNLVVQLMRTGQLRFSTQILQEFFVTMTRKVAQPSEPTEVVQFMDDLIRWPFVAVDYALIRQAAQLTQEATISFWDALIVAAAARSGSSVLYTEDLNHGQLISGVRIENPFRAQPLA
jgi:predicted nucleic acid-binding protein